MKKTFKYVALEAIFAGQNVRLPGLAHTDELYEDIKANGLKEPPWVFGVGNESYEMIRGHLRLICLDRLQNEEPTRFLELFPGGKVEVVVLSDITYEQAQIEKIDHGNENPLTNIMEAQLCANMLFEAGCTEAQVATQLAGLMNRIKPMKADKRKELELLRKDVDTYRETGRDADIPEKERQIAQLLLDYRKGWIQNMKAQWRCPDVVAATMFLKATGERNWHGILKIDIADDVYLPSRLQVDQVKSKLWPAFKKDLAISTGGACPYNKRVPGPNFNEAWDAICEKSKEKESAPETVRAKAFSKAELQTDAEKYLSQGFKMLCSFHRRDPEVDPNRLKELDQIAYYAELVCERSGEEWTQFEALAKNLEALKKDEQKEIEAAEKDTTATPPPAKDDKETPAKVINRPRSKSKAKRAAAAKAEASGKKEAASK